MFKETQEHHVEDGVAYANHEVGSGALPFKKVESKEGQNFNSFLENMPEVVCLSHLRWDFVYQRPQHLLSRFARYSRLYFVEEPIYSEVQEPYLDISTRGENIHIAVPHLPQGLSPEQVEEQQRRLLDKMLESHSLVKPILWYYTPMALSFTDHLQPLLTVYDCMDELSAFKYAPSRLKELEQALFRKADLVFTGGQSLYEVKKQQHPAVHAFPSSIDKDHFAQAKEELPQPADQAAIPAPRLGFFGVIDERMDLDLLAALADAKPEWQLVIVGPIVKIDPASVPQRPNIHLLGGKSYQELPAYLSGWQVALLPFAINEATAFISPTKTPEYLAAGKPVVSTPIRDVVRPYGEEGLVHIASTAPEFVEAIQAALAQQNVQSWREHVKRYMANMSWDRTWRDMVELLAQAAHQKNQQ